MKIKYVDGKLNQIELEQHTDTSTASWAVDRVVGAYQASPEDFPSLDQAGALALQGVAHAIRQQLREQKQRDFSLSKESFGHITLQDKQAEAALGAIAWLASRVDAAHIDPGKAKGGLMASETVARRLPEGHQLGWNSDDWFAANASDMIDSMPEIEFDTGTIRAIVGDSILIGSSHNQ